MATIKNIEVEKANDRTPTPEQAMEWLTRDINMCMHLLYIVNHDETMKKAIVKRLLTKQPMKVVKSQENGPKSK